MKLRISLLLPIVGTFALVNSSDAATVVVKVDLTGAAPSLGPVSISTGAVRTTGQAPPINVPVSGTISPEISGPSAQNAAAREESGDSPRRSAQNESPGRSRSSEQRNGAGGSANQQAGAQPGYSAKGDSKAGPDIVFTDPGAFQLSIEAGYASNLILRGIDLVQFTSYNYLETTPTLDSSPDSGVTYLGATATYKGFAFGVKYIESIADDLNPFFAPFASTLDSYSELDLSVNYTRMLVGDDWLLGTVGFDFYYYPNALFWGVDNQGMVSARFSSPHYKWAQPFLDLFYNVPIDSEGSGLAKNSLARGAEGSELVEGWGSEMGVRGGDRVWSNDIVSVAATYSLSTIFKQDYAFEENGFSAVSLTLGMPITIGKNFTITPSLSYIEALQSIPNRATVPATPNNGELSKAWNEPGLTGTLTASWRF